MNLKKNPGKSFKDFNGVLNYNNGFSLSIVKRFNTIESKETLLKRRWQGHKIEQRWCNSVVGRFETQLILLDNWYSSSSDLKRITFELEDDKLNVLNISSGFITSIQYLKQNSKLLIMSDFEANKIKLEYRFLANYFIKY